MHSYREVTAAQLLAHLMATYGKITSKARRIRLISSFCRVGQNFPVWANVYRDFDCAYPEQTQEQEQPPRELARGISRCLSDH
jgi:hypothetical protein